MTPSGPKTMMRRGRRERQEVEGHRLRLRRCGESAIVTAPELMTEEFEFKMLEELTRRHGRFIKHGEVFRVQSHEVEEDAWTMTVVFENADKSLHLPVEVALLVSENPKLKNDEARDVLVDFVGYFFERYFRESREVTLPIDWGTIPFGEFVIRARGWEKNLKLEELADRFLAGEDIGHLVETPRKKGT